MIQYSTKFICGKSPGTGAAPGDYWTAVNVHNPSLTGVQFLKKFVVAPPEWSRNEGAPPGETPPGTKPPPPRPQILPASLGPDEALEIDRAEILALFEHLGQPFLK